MAGELNFKQELVAAFGQPIAENPTQVMIEAAFRHHGLEWRYLTIEVAPAGLEAAVEGARAMGFRGFNCTIPHKVAVIEHLDGLGESAALMGAVNCVVRKDDRFIGENTDGKGFVEGLQRLCDPAGTSIVIFGAGGAARAITVEMALAGARRFTVVNRDQARGRTLVDLLNGQVRAETGRELSAELVPWRGDYAVPEDTDILVNATSIGLYPDVDARLALDVGTLRPGMIVADVIPNPPQHPPRPRRRGAGLPGDRRPRHAGRPGPDRHHLLDRHRPRRAGHAPGPRGGLRRLEALAIVSSLAPIRYVRGGVTQVDVDRFERFVILRHGEQMLRKGWHALRLERLKPLELFCGDDHHGWDAALGDELGLAASRCLDQGAEATLRVVQRPGLHDPSFRG